MPDYDTDPRGLLVIVLILGLCLGLALSRGIRYLEEDSAEEKACLQACGQRESRFIDDVCHCQEPHGWIMVGNPG